MAFLSPKARFKWSPLKSRITFGPGELPSGPGCSKISSFIAITHLVSVKPLSHRWVILPWCNKAIWSYWEILRISSHNLNHSSRSRRSSPVTSRVNSKVTQNGKEGWLKLVSASNQLPQRFFFYYSWNPTSFYLKLVGQTNYHNTLLLYTTPTHKPFSPKYQSRQNGSTSKFGQYLIPVLYKNSSPANSPQKMFAMVKVLRVPIVKDVSGHSSHHLESSQ